MKRPKDNPFLRLVGASEVRHEQARARDLVAYEENRLEYLLHQFHLMPRAARQLRQAHVERYGSPALTFAGFNAAYPSFPLVLGVAGIKDLHLDPRCFLPNLFKAYDRTPFVLAYEEFFDQETARADGRALGLVFRRKGIRHGLIIHDGADLPPRVFTGTVLQYQAGRKRLRRLYVQPYQTVVEQLHHGGHGWRP